MRAGVGGGRGAPVCQPLCTGLRCLSPQRDGDAVPLCGEDQPGGARAQRVRGYLGCQLRGQETGAREILPRQELECWGQPWVHGRAWGGGESLGCRGAPWGSARAWGAGEHPRAQGSLILLPGKAEMGAQGTPTPQRQLAPLSFPDPSRVPPSARAAPSPARRAQFRHLHNCCPRAWLCWSSPGAGCILS